MPGRSRSTDLKGALAAVPGVVSVRGIRFEKNFIKYFSVGTGSIGEAEVRRLQAEDAAALFEFYSAGLSEWSRRMFAPYPLFHTPPADADELSARIRKWKKEEDDWTAAILVKGGQIIGFGLLKRIKSAQATSALAVRDEFLRKGLGFLLQKIIVAQARELGMKRFHVKIVSDNLASVRVHEKCGFRKTGILPASLYPEIFAYLAERDREKGRAPEDRSLIEMVLDLQNEADPACA